MGMLDGFDSSVVQGGLKAFSCSVVISSFGTSASFDLASAGIEQPGSVTRATLSLSFSTSAISIRLGRCVKTLTFFDLDTLEVAEVKVFLFFPCFRMDSNNLDTMLEVSVRNNSECVR
jgi:FtsZ-interacting cell division protein ZipA